MSGFVSGYNRTQHRMGASLHGEPPLAPHDFERLQPYLRAALMNELRRAPDAPAPALIEQSLTHLYRLLSITASHLPAYLVEQVARSPTPGQIGGRFVQGTLLFADVSGFTAMSERLSRTGREGAEEISSIINRYFGAMLTILREGGGHLLKFGGDALLGLFLEPESALHAAQAALRMQTAMADFAQTETSQGVFPLRMKVGLRRGRFFSAQLGTAQGMENAVFGADVNATAAAESAAAAGQVLLDRATLDAIGAPCRTTAAADPYSVVHAVEAPFNAVSTPPPALIDPHAPSLTEVRRAVQLLDALTPYLPVGLLGRLAGDTRALALEGEHRTVAVLFANVHGLGEVVDTLGAEAGQEARITTALNTYFTAMQTAIQQYGGVVNKMDLYDHGDKLLAFFGAPVAHEDDAERAVRAALAMQRGLADSGLSLRQQIGLSYGSVFAGYLGTDWRHEYTVMGDEVNLAARLMTVAGASDVIISQGARRKVKALFELDPRGEVRLKGKSEPIPTFAVTGARAAPEPARGAEGLRAPLVGRSLEWSRLLMAAEKTLAGEGQIVSVLGEAGLGKSRLADELRERVEGRTRWHTGRCLSYATSFSYLAFLELLRQLTGLQADDDEAEAWPKLRRAVERWLPAGEQQDDLIFLANFFGLGLEAEQRARLRYLDPEALQRRTFIALRNYLDAYAQAGPLVIMLDDIQWLDEASARLLVYLLPLAETRPVCWLLLARPEPESDSARLSQTIERDFGERATTVTLRGLSAEDSQTMLHSLVPLEAWPAELETLVVSRTEGNPLYIEEVVRAFVEGGALFRDEDGNWATRPNMSALEVPDSLQGVMMTRLDRLEETSRRTAQVGAVVGRTFAFDVLRHVLEDQTAQVNHSLADLQTHEIVAEDVSTPERDYAFLHGLMQEVSYNSLLARTRRLHHRKIAEYLEDHWGEAETTNALTAHHAYLGQDWPRALKFQRLAGDQSRTLFANKDAIDHFLKALHSAEQLPPETTVAERLAIHTALGELLTITAQYDAAQTHLQLARELATARGDVDADAHACRWLARLEELRGNYPPALHWVDETLGVLNGRDTADAAEALLIAGLIKVRQGHASEALERCQQVLLIAEMLDELYVMARAYSLLGIVVRNLGDYAQATQHFQQAIQLYQRIGNIHGQGIAYNQTANTFFNMGRWQEADRDYRQSAAMLTQVGDTYNRALVENNLGGIALNQGRLDEALTFYHNSLRALTQIGTTGYMLGAVYNNLGATHLRRGEVEPARENLRASQASFEQAQARDFLPELHRHFAEAALLAQELAEAEAQGQRALALARELSMRGEEGNSLRVLGDIAAARLEFEQAEQDLRQSVSILTEVGEQYEAARSQLSLARVLAARGDAEAVRAALSQCIPIFQQLAAALDLQEAHHLQAALPR
jgi:class 3 adenylate cyclase/predicted ATPase